MNTGVKMTSKLGCLLAVEGPLAAVLRVLLGRRCAVILNVLFRKAPFTRAVAYFAQQLLDGTSGTWDVDDHEQAISFVTMLKFASSSTYLGLQELFAAYRLVRPGFQGH